MFGLKSLAAVGLLLPLQAMAKHGAADQKRELTYALRQLYARESYPVQSEPNPPSCAEGYDNPDPQTGECGCGQGRVPVAQGLCAVANGGGDFRVLGLTSPQPVARPITWSNFIAGPGSVMNAAQCGGICSEDSNCIGFYLTPAADDATAYCWLIGGSDVYDSPEGTGLPFTPSGARLARRAEGQTGSIGEAGGVFGVVQAVAPTNPQVGCNTDLGDQAADDLSGCICGPGRVNETPETCRYPASAGARLTRRIKRDAFEGVPW